MIALRSSWTLKLLSSSKVVLLARTKLLGESNLRRPVVMLRRHIDSCTKERRSCWMWVTVLVWTRSRTSVEHFMCWFRRRCNRWRTNVSILFLWAAFVNQGTDCLVFARVSTFSRHLGDDCSLVGIVRSEPQPMALTAFKKFVRWCLLSARRTIVISFCCVLSAI